MGNGPDFPTILLAGAIYCAVAGAIVGSQKRATMMGAVWGFVFGPLGVIIALSLDERRKCPRCRGRINDEPPMCQHCYVRLRWIDDPMSVHPKPAVAEEVAVPKASSPEPRTGEDETKAGDEIATQEPDMSPMSIEASEIAAVVEVSEEGPPMRAWTDVTGRHRIVAEFQGLVGDKVKLKQANGLVGTLLLSKLCAEDQAWVKSQGLR